MSTGMLKHMTLGVIGLNHQTATLIQREKLSTYDIIPQLKKWLSEDLGFIEAAVLSTCNRYEVYFASSIESFSHIQKKLTHNLINVLGTESEDVLYSLSHETVVTHLFSVTCGLDSLIIGEDQILGQVKNCISDAQNMGMSGKILNKLFREAISFAKSVKTEFKISENPLSLSYIAVKKAIERGCLDEGSTVTMVGLGKMGTLAINYVLDQPVHQVKIAVRSPEKLPKHILEHPKVRLFPFEERYACILDSDVIISSTSAPHTVMRFESLIGYKENSIWIDLSMPRDIDERIESKCQVEIWTIDYFKDISDSNIKRRVELKTLIREVMQKHIDDYWFWLSAIEVDDILKNWQQTIQSLVQEGLEIADNKKLIDQPDKKDKWSMVMESILKKMIRAPLVNLKSIQDKSERDLYVKMLKELFDYD